MVDYEVTVSTTNLATATTLSNVFIKLVGRDGESDRKWLVSIKGAASFFRGAVSWEYPSLFKCAARLLISAYRHI